RPLNAPCARKEAFSMKPAIRLILLFSAVQFSSAAALPAAEGSVSVSVSTATMSDVNNFIFGMMTVSSLEEWNTRDPEFVKLAADMGVTHFQYPGGSLNYWWHYDPKGVGYCFRPEEYAQAASQRHEASMQATENFLSKFIDLCKATNAAAIVNANVWHGTPDELDGALADIERNGLKALSVILGVELQLGGGRIMTAEEYAARAKNYVAMLRSKHPGTKIFAWAAPLDPIKANSYSQQWNTVVSKIENIDGLTQYQWCRNAVQSEGAIEQRFDYGMKELKSFMAGLDAANAALARYSPRWDIDQWGMVDLGSPGGAKSAYGGTMLQFLHTCWYLLYVTDYNHRHSGFYQSLEYMKFGSSYSHDPLSLKVKNDPRGGFRINPAYYAFQLMTNIRGAKYAPATTNGSPDAKAYYFENNKEKWLCVLNLAGKAAAIETVAVDGAPLKPVLQKAYGSDTLFGGPQEIQPSQAGEPTISPYSVSWFILR
ncbi:MAG: hypothetical protein NTW86_05960, partial [Candidatus Sumerlaeota bacterium]|nr:hypothetical protein [Candidatus Sumerlaeota bacterium]